MIFQKNLVICSLCVNLFLCVKATYRAAIVDSTKNVDLNSYAPFIQDAAKLNADILILPTPDEANNGAEYYDETVKTLSKAVNENEIYVVAHLYEKARCQSKSVLIRSNLVFDRRGAVISIYRKPQDKNANCTTSTPEPPEFSTDFGVTFGLMMEEDLVLKSAGSLKNYIVAGEWQSDIPFLSASQFSSSWAYVTNANLLFSGGIYAGKAGLKTGSGKMSVVNLYKNCDSEETTAPVITPSKSYPSEDLNQYTIRPLNAEASLRGYTETVCHDAFCCEFHIKTGFVGLVQSDVSYGLAVSDGIRNYGGHHHIGVQTCALFACAGLYKRSCDIGLVNSNNINIEKVTITGNFTGPKKAQFPLILLPNKNLLTNFTLKLETLQKSQKLTIEASNSNLISFGIFGRDFSQDFQSENVQVNNEGLTYEYLYNEDVQEFFDYVWIRLRIMLVIVSIYVLEMM